MPRSLPRPLSHRRSLNGAAFAGVASLARAQKLLLPRQPLPHPSFVGLKKPFGTRAGPVVAGLEQRPHPDQDAFRRFDRSHGQPGFWPLPITRSAGHAHSLVGHTRFPRTLLARWASPRRRRPGPRPTTALSTPLPGALRLPSTSRKDASHRLLQTDLHHEHPSFSFDFRHEHPIDARLELSPLPTMQPEARPPG